MGQNLVIDGSACVKNAEQNNDEREAEVLNAGRNASLQASTEMRAELGRELRPRSRALTTAALTTGL